MDRRQHDAPISADGGFDSFGTRSRDKLAEAFADSHIPSARAWTVSRHLSGIGEDVTWEEFTALVCSRLQLRGLKGLYHAASGAPLRTMAELLDVEDLEAEEADPEPPGSRGDGSAADIAISPAGVMTARGGGKSARGGMDAGASDAVGVTVDHDVGENKYAFRVPIHVRVMRVFAPWLESTLGATRGGGLMALPLSSAPSKGKSENPQEGSEASRGLGLRRKRRRGGMDPRRIVIVMSLLSCVATILLLHSRLSPLTTTTKSPIGDAPSRTVAAVETTRETENQEQSGGDGGGGGDGATGAGTDDGPATPQEEVAAAGDEALSAGARRLFITKSDAAEGGR